MPFILIILAAAAAVFVISRRQTAPEVTDTTTTDIDVGNPPALDRFLGGGDTGIAYGVSPGPNVPPGSVLVTVRDTDPEKGSYEAPDFHDYYSILAVERRPATDDYYEILATDLDKRVGGRDRLLIKYPDGRREWRTRERGEKWPSDWRDKLFIADFRTYATSHPFQFCGALATQCSGNENLRYLVCRARHDRDPGRKQIELTRIGKMFKRFRDEGEVYWLPVVFRYMTAIAGFMTGGGAMFGKFSISTLHAVTRAGYRGDIVGWKSGMRAAMRGVNAGAITEALRTLVPELDIDTRRLYYDAYMVRGGVTNAGKLIAAVQGARWQFWRDANARVQEGPSKALRVLVYT